MLVIGGVALIRFGSPAVGLNIQLFYTFIVQLGMILLVPKLTQIGAWLIRPVMNRFFGIEGLIAVETMANSPRRTTATVIALMIGLALVFSHESFIRSQKTGDGPHAGQGVECRHARLIVKRDTFAHISLQRRPGEPHRIAARGRDGRRGAQRPLSLMADRK